MLFALAERLLSVETTAEILAAYDMDPTSLRILANCPGRPPLFLLGQPREDEAAGRVQDYVQWANGRFHLLRGMVDPRNVSNDRRLQTRVAQKANESDGRENWFVLSLMPAPPPIRPPEMR